MIIKLLFICIILFILKLFIIKFNIYDYFNVTLSFLLILFSYLYIIYGSIKLILIIFFIAIILVIYSYNKLDSNDSSVIILNGNINIKNMIKNKYSLLKLFNDLKKDNILSLNKNICAVLVNNKLMFYYKNKINNRVVSIIINGNICYKELEVIGKDYNWLSRLLDKTKLDSIIYSFYFNNILYIIKK